MCLRVNLALLYLLVPFIINSQVDSDSLAVSISKLFIVTADNIDFTYKYQPKYILSSDIQKDGDLKKKGFELILNSEANHFDTIPVAFPNYKVVNAIQDKTFIDSLYNNTQLYVHNLGYQGVLLPNPYHATYTVYSSLSDEQKRVAFFPKYLDFLTGKKRSVKKDDKDITNTIPFYSGNYFQDNDVKIEDFLNHKILFFTNNFKEDHQKLLQAFRNKKMNLEIIESFKKTSITSTQKLTPDSLYFINDIAEEQYILRKKSIKKSISVWQKESILPLVNLNQISYDIWDCRKVIEPSVQSLINQNLVFAKTDSSILEKDFLFIVTDKELSGKELNDKLNEDNYRNIILITNDLINVAKGFNNNRKPDVIISALNPSDLVWEYLIEGLFSSFKINGKQTLPNSLIAVDYKLAILPKLRLGHSFPIEEGLNPDSLNKIDEIIKEAIRSKDTPGAQILIARKGNIIYQKSFGHLEYNQKEKVDNDKLYDLASVTKLIGTFPMVMKLYEDESLNIEEKIGHYLHELDTTNKREITVKELLIHQSGLKSFIPFHYNAIDYEQLKSPLFSGRFSSVYNIKIDKHYFQNGHAQYRKDIFQEKKDSTFNIKVCNSVYMNPNYIDSIYSQLYNSPLLENKSYLYSDLGYMLLDKIIEKQSNTTIDSLFYNQFSIPLGASKLVYNPLEKYSISQIVPTENDLPFRKELLRGYVHDQTTAMMGGVAAHAGLFSNAEDLAKMSQMLLNKGSYGGFHFLQPSTIERFTKVVNPGNRRGIGVDKPETDPDKESPVSRFASPSSYGHSGFTGTLVWIDPEYDLIFIFLSNRVYPRAYNRGLIEENIRTKIQDVVYKSIMDKNIHDRLSATQN